MKPSSSLTFQNVSHSQILRCAHTAYLHISYVSQNRERILPHITFICTNHSRDSERLLRGTNWICRQYKLFCVLNALKSKSLVLVHKNMQNLILNTVYVLLLPVSRVSTNSIQTSDEYVIIPIKKNKTTNDIQFL